VRNFALALAGVVIFHLGGCSQNLNTKEAVRQGVIDHLAKRKNLDLNLSQMDVDISSVTFRSNEADAVVSFRPKGSPSGGMQMNYTLERSGNQWKVKAKADNGANPHGAPPAGAMPEMPSGHPPMPTPGAGSPK
jgi:hypothetical protein